MLLLGCLLFVQMTLWVQFDPLKLFDKDSFSEIGVSSQYVNASSFHTFLLDSSYWAIWFLVAIAVFTCVVLFFLRFVMIAPKDKNVWRRFRVAAVCFGKSC